MVEKGQLVESAVYAVKAPYALELLGLPELPEYWESELEARIIDHYDRKVKLPFDRDNQGGKAVSNALLSLLKIFQFLFDEKREVYKKYGRSPPQIQFRCHVVYLVSTFSHVL